MKQIVTFSITLIITMFVIWGGAQIYKVCTGPKSSYSLSSYVSVENNDGKVTESEIALKSCINSKGDFELKIEAGTNDEKVVGFEISFLINYNQTQFKINGSDDMINSYRYYDQDKFSVVLDKNEFDNYCNQFIINIRQDIDVKSKDNELIRDSSTVNLRYNVVNNQVEESQFEKSIMKVGNVTNLDGTEEAICEVRTINREESALLVLLKDAKLEFDLLLGGNQEEYLVFAYMDSNQILINDKKFLLFNLNKKTAGSYDIMLDIPKEAGIYELEIYCVPNPYAKIDMKRIYQYTIIFPKRYSIEVE